MSLTINDLLRECIKNKTDPICLTGIVIECYQNKEYYLGVVLCNEIFDQDRLTSFSYLDTYKNNQDFLEAVCHCYYKTGNYWNSYYISVYLYQYDENRYQKIHKAVSIQLDTPITPPTIFVLSPSLTRYKNFLTRNEKFYSHFQRYPCPLTNRNTIDKVKVVTKICQDKQYELFIIGDMIDCTSFFKQKLLFAINQGRHFNYDVIIGGKVSSKDIDEKQISMTRLQQIEPFDNLLSLSEALIISKSGCQKIARNLPIDRLYEVDPPLVKNKNIKKVNPLTLLSPKRIDIIAKYIYVKYLNLGISGQWFRDIYKEHILVFNGGYEPAAHAALEGTKSPVKKDINAFIEMITNLNHSIRNDGYDETKSLVPIGKNGVIIDGSHRVGVCLYHNIPMTVLIKDDEVENEYNYRYFMTYHYYHRMKKWIMERMILEYCQLKHPLIITVSPIIYNSSYQRVQGKFSNTLRKYGDIVYRKFPRLNFQGYRNLLYVLCNYNKKQVNDYLLRLNSGDDDVFLVYAVSLNDMYELPNLQSDLINLLKCNPLQIHFTSIPASVNVVSNIYFNNNSLHLLEKIDYLNINEKLYNTLQDYINEYCNLEDKEYYCLGGETAKCLIDNRECSEVDLIDHSKVLDKYKLDQNNYSISRDNIIFDQRYHAFIYGVKIVLPQLDKNEKI
jgi:hypothetical protein